MADYRLPMDEDGVKYHGVVDRDGENPGQVLYGLDKNGRLKPVNVDDEGNVLTRLTGSNVEKRFYGALAKKRHVEYNGGIQFDGGHTARPKIEPNTSVNVISVSGAGEGLFMRYVTDNVSHYEATFELAMDDIEIARAHSGAGAGRFINPRTFDRFNLTGKGDSIAFMKVSMWDDNEKAYVFDIDLSKMGKFQNGFSVSLTNDTEEPIGMTALVYFETLASPEVVVYSKSKVDTSFIRSYLSEKHGNINDFTVTRTLIQKEDYDIYQYTISYRIVLKESELTETVESLLN